MKLFFIDIDEISQFSFSFLILQGSRNYNLSSTEVKSTLILYQ